MILAMKFAARTPIHHLKSKIFTDHGLATTMNCVGAHSGFTEQLVRRVTYKWLVIIMPMVLASYFHGTTNGQEHKF